MRSTMDNGQQRSKGTVEAHKCGKTVVSLSVTGKTINQMEEVDLFMQMEMSTKESGRMTKHMVEEYMSTQTGQNMLENGWKIVNMGKDLKHGLMGLFTLATIHMAKNTGSESLNGVTAHRTVDSFIIITYMEKEITHGRMEDSMMESGCKTKCMAKEFLLGLMAGDIWASIAKTERRATEYFRGQMVVNIKVNGKTVSNTEEAHSLRFQVNKNTENGVVDKE